MSSGSPKISVLKIRSPPHSAVRERPLPCHFSTTSVSACADVGSSPAQCGLRGTDAPPALADRERPRTLQRGGYQRVKEHGRGRDHEPSPASQFEGGQGASNLHISPRSTARGTISVSIASALCGSPRTGSGQGLELMVSSSDACYPPLEQQCDASRGLFSAACGRPPAGRQTVTGHRRPQPACSCWSSLQFNVPNNVVVSRPTASEIDTEHNALAYP